MKIYAIIVTYNALRWIDRCLSALRESTVPVVPLLVDNSSTDGTVAHVQAHYPEALCLPQTQNLGFGQGNNVGFRHALQQDADYILLLNQDAYLAPDALACLLAQSDGESLLSPVHLNGDGTRLDRMFLYMLRETDSSILNDALLSGRLAPTYRVGRICAACWLLPAALLRRVGGFNPLFFHYGEDDNYLHRLRHKDIPVVLVPAASMRHDRGEAHGNMVVFNSNRLRRDLLLVATDVNLSLPGRLKGLVRRLYQCYAWDLPKRAYRPGAFLLALLWLLRHACAIRQSRQREEREEGVWL